MNCVDKLPPTPNPPYTINVPVLVDVDAVFCEFICMVKVKPGPV